MKWNKSSGGRVYWQTSKKGTARARLYYFVTQHGTGDTSYAVGYYGFNQSIIMQSAGTFKTAQEAREYCEKLDAETLIIEEVSA